MRSFSLSERHRKFAREVGSVVLGVLIALGLGEAATEIRWRFDAADARSAMLTDLERDAGVMHERQLARPCIERRLRDVDALLRQARQSGELPLVSTIGRPRHARWSLRPERWVCRPECCPTSPEARQAASRQTSTWSRRWPTT